MKAGFAPDRGPAFDKRSPGPDTIGDHPAITTGHAPPPNFYVPPRETGHLEAPNRQRADSGDNP